MSSNSTSKQSEFSSHIIDDMKKNLLKDVANFKKDNNLKFAFS